MESIFLWLVFTVNCWYVHAGCDLITCRNTFPRMQHNVGSVPSLQCSPTPVPRSSPNHVSHACVRLGQPQACIQTHSIMLGVHRRITIHNLLWRTIKESTCHIHHIVVDPTSLLVETLSGWPFFWTPNPSSTLLGASQVCDGLWAKPLSPFSPTQSYSQETREDSFVLCGFFLGGQCKVALLGFPFFSLGVLGCLASIKPCNNLATLH